MDTKTDYFSHYFILGQNNMKKNMEKIMQITNNNKRFMVFTTMIKHENHTIDNRAMISENSDDFYITLKGPWECYHSKWEISGSFKMISSTRNHEDFFSHQHSETVARRCFIKKLSLMISKTSQENMCARDLF